MSSRHSLNTLEKAWAVEVENILKALEDEQGSGLIRAEVQKSLEQFGQKP